MTKKKLERLKKKIIEAVPDIIELKFGCKVVMIGAMKNINTITSVFESQGRYGYAMKPYTCCWDGARGDATARRYSKEDFKIIGRDITLADAILFIRKKLDTVNNQEYEYEENFVKHWDLTKNNLDMQKEKTLTFLYNLICE